MGLAGVSVVDAGQLSDVSDSGGRRKHLIVYAIEGRSNEKFVEVRVAIHIYINDGFRIGRAALDLGVFRLASLGAPLFGR